MEIVGVLFIGIYFAVGVVTALRDIICAPRCEHGVRNGNKRKSNGKLKCPECQIALEQKQKLIEEQNKKELEYKKKRMEIQNKFSSLLSQAIMLRKQTLLSEEKAICQLSPLEFENYIAVLYTRLG